MIAKKINVQKLYEAYLYRGKVIRYLSTFNFILGIVTLLTIVWCYIHTDNIKESSKPEVSSLQIIQDDALNKNLEFIEVELPPLPSILPKS